MRRLLIVEQVFAVGTRGVIVVSEIEADVPWPKAPVQVEVRRPDGSVIDAVAYLEIPLYNPPRPSAKPILQLKDLSKDDVPVHSEIWLKEPVPR